MDCISIIGKAHKNFRCSNRAVCVLMMNRLLYCVFCSSCVCVCVCFQLKMVLIKCCDISNEVRPTEVAEPWVDCLLEEYFMQVTSTTAFTQYLNAAATATHKVAVSNEKMSPRMCFIE